MDRFTRAFPMVLVLSFEGKAASMAFAQSRCVGYSGTWSKISCAYLICWRLARILSILAEQMRMGSQWFRFIIQKCSLISLLSMYLWGNTPAEVFDYRKYDVWGYVCAQYNEKLSNHAIATLCPSLIYPLWSLSSGNLHMGQVRLFLPHSSMHSLWKRCPQGVILVSVFSTFSRQIMHSLSSYLMLGSKGYSAAGMKSSKELISLTITAGWQTNLGPLLRKILRQMAKEMQMSSMDESVETTINSPILSPLIRQNSQTVKVIFKGLDPPVQFLSALLSISLLGIFFILISRRMYCPLAFFLQGKMTYFAIAH